MKVVKGERRKRAFWAERTHTEGCSEKKQEGESRLNQREEDRFCPYSTLLTPEILVFILRVWKGAEGYNVR